MPDDERKRRRLGDETKSRIADLASGWTVDGPSSEPPPAPVPPRPSPTGAQPTVPPAAPAGTPRPASPTGSQAVAPPVGSTEPSGPARKKPRTNPPPPPGSPERKALEDKIVATKDAKDDPTEERPPPPLRAKAPTGSQAAVKQPMQPPVQSGSGPQRAIKSATGPQPAIGRTKAPSVPPPMPPIPASAAAAISARTRSPSNPPPAAPASGPRFPRAGYDGPAPPLQTTADDPAFAREKGTFTSEPRTPAVIVDESLRTPDLIAAADAAIKLPLPATPPPPAIRPPAARVPIGEFDSGAKTIEDYSRPSQTTAIRDAADALLKIPDQVTPIEDLVERESPMRGDPTVIDPQTAKFERGDPTQDRRPDATEIQPPSVGRFPTGGTLRATAALRRKRGLLGDVRYVFTAVFGVRRSRKELGELEHRQGLRQISRKRHLVTLGRTAVVADTFDHPALGKAREQLQRIEEERGKHAGAVAASDAELERVRRDREAKAKEYVDGTSAADAELADLAKKLEPLEKEASQVRKRAQELRDSLRRTEKQIADTTALLVSVKGEKMDKAAIQADIATAKADKQAVLRDEPVIAAQLDALNPRIAAIEASRAELLKKKQELEKAEKEDQGRTSELLEAIGAKRKVVERASQEAETARDDALFELGERLYVDRPKSLSTLLSPIDQIDLELGEGDRRMMELREILSNIDRWKFARGTAMIIVAATLVICFLWWVFALLF
ncbi:MAG TPA: hypothetical protein VLB44_04095 [Kofleriaceae bacterium]|nr:hypothetical protein [Kofleriaceae bacterium]